MQLPTAEQRSFFEAAATRYHSDLTGDICARGYLAGRGLLRAAGTFRLGVVRQPLLGHERYTGRLSIPYLTPAGVVGFSFRCIAPHVCDGHPKYMALEAMERSLYNVLDLRADSARIYLVEGEIDAMTWSMNGWPTVGIPGVENFKDFHGRCLTDFAEVFALTDGDDAGYKLGSFLAREVKARVIRLPRGEDGNSLYVKGGRDALSRVLTG